MNKKLDSEKVTHLRPKNRYNSGSFKMTEKGVFNVKNIPIGYNWLLGYSEKSSMNF